MTQFLRLGDFCRLVRGDSATLKTEPGQYPLVVTAAYRRSARTYQLEGPAVCVPLISSTGHGDAALHRVHFQDGRFALANLLVALLPNDPTLCDAKYLYYLLQQRKDDLFVPLMKGTANVSLKERDIAQVSVPLPPLSEQQQVVKYVDALSIKIIEAKQLRQEAIKELSLLCEQIASTLIGDHTWSRVTIEDLVGRANLKNGISLKSSPFNSNIRCLTLSSIRNGGVDTNESKPVPMNEGEAGPYLVRPNDVYLVRGNGSKDLVGRAGIVRNANDNLIFPDLLIKVPLNPARILPEYFVTIWNSRVVRNQIKDLAKTTSGIWKVNQGHVASVQIPLPPLSVQAQIVSHTRQARLSCSDMLTFQRETESELDAMLPAILGQLFNGGGDSV